MATSRDIRNAATHLIKTHGREAARFASVSSDHLADRRDDTGATYWRSIAEVVRSIEGSILASKGNRPHELAN